MSPPPVRSALGKGRDLVLLAASHFSSPAEIECSSNDMYLGLQCWRHSNLMPCVDVLERGGLKWYGFIHSTVLFLENGKNYMIASTGLLVLI